MKCKAGIVVILLAFVALAFVALACGGSVKQQAPDLTIEDLSTEDTAPPQACLAEVPPVPDGDPVPPDVPHGLVVKLTSQEEFPSGATSFTVQSGSWDAAVAPTVSVGGFVVGDYDSLTIAADFEGADAPLVLDAPEEAASGFSYFNTPPIRLQAPQQLAGKSVARSTTIRVVAERGELQAWDVAVVTANPGFLFPIAPRRMPQVAFVGVPTDVVMSIDLNRVENFDSGAVHLMESDALCTTWANGEEMLDDGNLFVGGSGDEIPNDRVYSRRIKVTEDAPTIRYYRIAVQIGPDEDRKVAFSPCVPFHVVPSISVVSCSAVEADIVNAGNLYDKLLCQGVDPVDAKEQTARFMQSQAGVVEAGFSLASPLVWAAYDSGLLVAVEPYFLEPGIPEVLFSASGETPELRTTLESRLAVTSVKSGDFKDLLGHIQCPPIRNQGDMGELSSLRAIAVAGVAFFGNGGGLAFGSLSDDYKLAHNLKIGSADFARMPAWTGWKHEGPQEVAWTQTQLQCENLFDGVEACLYRKDGACCVGDGAETCTPCPAHLECVVNKKAEEGSHKGTLYDATQADLMSGRAVLGRDGKVGILPAFVQLYSGVDLANQFVFLGFSGSLIQGAMAAQFLAGGANTVVGTTKQVVPETAHVTGSALVKALAAEGTAPANLVPALEEAGSKTWAYVGPGNLDLSYSGLLNADFHTGDLRGWKHSGDARVLSYWCQESPPSGKFMTLISTGIGYTVQTGRISQEFCPMEVNQLGLSYNFISHEFLESCGTSSDDKFQVYLEDVETGNRIPVTKVGDQEKITLNHLCPWKADGCAACPGPPGCQCGDLQPLEPPWDLELWPEECGFSEDGDGKAYQALWRNILPVNISSVTGLERPINLVLRVDDESGTAVDTTVLIGSLLLQ